MNTHSLARGLSFFSIGLGLAEILAPRKVAKLIGVDENHERLLQMLGAREIASGLGIMQGNSGYFLWSRVAGDAMDLALLGAALNSRRADRHRVTLAMAAVGGVALLDVIASVLHTRDYSEPGWRVQNVDRAGIRRGDTIERSRPESQLALREG